MKIITLALAIFLALTPACAESPDYSDDTAYSNYAGRLYIPEVGIDVALYRSNKQYVVDRQDSAAYFDLSRWRGHMAIADHWTQGFATLKNVTVGMECCIVRPDGVTTHYTCVDVFDGRNTGHGITDRDGRFVHGDADMLMYTCIDGWENVRVVLFDVIEPSAERSAAHEAADIHPHPDPADAPALCAAPALPR